VDKCLCRDGCTYKKCKCGECVIIMDCPIACHCDDLEEETVE